MPSTTRPASAVVACLILLATASLGVAQSPRPLTVGGTVSRPGERTAAMITIPAGADSGTQIPVTIIQGGQAGPTLALIAGVHGAEVAPIVALQRVRALVDPTTLKGTLILVHVANMPSFLGRTIYRGPWDRKNLNRVFPGIANGRVSDRIAFALTSQIIDPSDYVVDMHGGDGNESLRPYAYVSNLGLDVRQDSLSDELARAWGADHIVVTDDKPTPLDASLYVDNTARMRGKVAITAEAGALGVPTESMVQRNVDGALRVLRWLGMMPGVATRQTAVTYLDESEVLESPATGTWHAAVEPGTTVARDQVIGRVTDFYGTTLAEIRAPWAGEVLYVIGSPAMSKGEPVAMLGRTVKRR